MNSHKHLSYTQSAADTGWTSLSAGHHIASPGGRLRHASRVKISKGLPLAGLCTVSGVVDCAEALYGNLEDQIYATSQGARGIIKISAGLDTLAQGVPNPIFGPLTAGLTLFLSERHHDTVGRQISGKMKAINTILRLARSGQVSWDMQDETEIDPLLKKSKDLIEKMESHFEADRIQNASMATGAGLILLPEPVTSGLGLGIMITAGITAIGRLLSGCSDRERTLEFKIASANNTLDDVFRRLKPEK
ncbi:MAG: hypothetical protein ACI9BD_000548 [Candidatus Marinamargulisbacteria bacterium]|jgi:hypothetical protein